MFAVKKIKKFRKFFPVLKNSLNRKNRTKFFLVKSAFSFLHLKDQSRKNGKNVQKMDAWNQKVRIKKKDGAFFLTICGKFQRNDKE